MIAAMSCRLFALSLLTCCAASAARGQTAPVKVLDTFESIASWKTQPSDGTFMRITQDAGHNGGKSMRIDFGFSGGGYAVVRRAVPIDLPPNYELSFYIRGEALPQNLEVKLVDSTGDNVWWRNQRDFEFSPTWRRVSIKKRQIEFAWGPAGGGELRRAAALEIAITAGSGGRGTVWLDDLTLVERPTVAALPSPPVASSSSALTAGSAALAIDPDSSTVWRSARGDRSPWIAIDFGRARELGGLIVDWAPGAHAIDYDVVASSDGRQWETLYTMRGSDGGRDYVALPETETRLLRLNVKRAANPATGVAVRSLLVQPLAFGASRNAFFTAVAHDARRGDYPKYYTGAQSYWTTIGTDGDAKEALINEQGMLEVDKAAFSIEPFLFSNERLITWADVETTPSLLDGYLPIPSVRWRASDLDLDVTAFTYGARDQSVLLARYRVTNRSSASRSATLFLALRPFQVNPPAQFLNTPGGASVVRSIAWDGGAARVQGDRRVGRKRVLAITRPSAFGATTFDAGGIMPALRRGRVPSLMFAEDSTGAASGVFSYVLRLASKDSADVWIAVPFHSTAVGVLPNRTFAVASRFGEARLKTARQRWHETLDQVAFALPRSGDRFIESIKANLAYMLISRDGPALQPGTRSYERSWIRDGAMMSAALLRLGRADVVREYAEWYAPYQYANGKVPCCVDARGADPVPENDSHGQLIYLVAEYYRYTRDRAFLERMWPHVQRAVSYIDSLRHSRMTPEYQTGDKRAFYGMMPQSISHEGYSAKPMHSYWDDLFTMRGLRDAAEIASALGKPERAAYARIRDEFRRDLVRSYTLAMAQHHIDYLPGAVELGDFDATSTTMGVSPGDEQDALPHPALERTFEKYYENFRNRRESATWVDYTPYELRVVGTMVRLGWRDRALELLDFFLAHQRPPAWRDWGEIVYRDSTATKFVGDMPHTWVGSDYIRSALDMIAYDRESDSTIVIGAGIPEAWVTTAPGVVVRGLRTYHGSLDLSMRASPSGDAVNVTISLERLPGRGIVLRSPMARALRSATIDGTPARLTTDGRGVIVNRARANVVLRY